VIKKDGVSSVAGRIVVRGRVSSGAFRFWIDNGKGAAGAMANLRDAFFKFGVVVASNSL
jgi:hypothetical protein